MMESRAGILIRQIHAILEKEANKMLAADDLTLSQVGLLLELGQSENGKMTFKDLEKRLGLAQSTTVGLISRLKKKKMLSAYTDPSDGRIKYAMLTEVGKRCCVKAEKSMHAQEEVLLKKLDAPERVQFIESLNKVKEALQQ